MTTPFPFVAGAVLTAAQLNDITNLPINDQTASYTLVVGDAGKRVVMNNAGATTITVNNSVFTAGDTILIANKGAGTCTITAGAGVTINTTGTLALTQYATGTLIALSASAFIYQAGGVAQTASGLTLISTTTIGNAVSSVTVSSAFSSTYDNYVVNVSGGTGTNNSDYSLTLGATATNYYYGTIGQSYNTVQQDNSSAGSGSFWRVVGHGTTTNACQIQIFGPNLAGRTTFFSWGNRPIASTSGSMQISGGFLDDATQYTAFTLAAGAGTLTGGTVKVYGYANS